MVIVLDRAISPTDKRHVEAYLIAKGFTVREFGNEQGPVLGAAGVDTIDSREIEMLPGVSRVVPVDSPYKLASREMHKQDSVIEIGNVKIGAGRIVVIAGPCSVEGREQIQEAAHAVRAAGAVMLRGGAFKPRTSPYSFQGLGESGLRYLKEAGEATGMPIVTEIVSPQHVEMMRDYVDMFQIGARNMQNFELLKQVGALSMPVLLKRGPAATIEEWLMAAEHLLAAGARDVVLCERGIRTFETATRFTLDISSIPVVKQLSHLPIIADPSHATGLRDKVPPVALAAIAAGADGLIVEAHPHPEQALSDGPQTLYIGQLERLLRDIETLSMVVEKELLKLPDKQESRPAFAGSSGEGLRVTFQGERGAYSEMALRRYFQSEQLNVHPQANFRAVFESVLAAEARYGILPIENSLSGSIHENYDLLIQYPDIRICGEIRIRIIHSLIGMPDARLEDIRTVYSHPQGLSQCGHFLDSLPDVEQAPFYDTAGAVKHIAQLAKPDCAAIANSEAAEIYGMQVLREGIETSPNNYTRFVIVARTENAPTDKSDTDKSDTAMLALSIPDRAGALSACMELFARRNLNLTKIESRPILGQPWRYLFYLDIDVPASTTAFQQALEELYTTAENVRVLGMYRK